ncbi:hypothetical protein HanIR_Chr07g0305621 [Helianthus annuus]|nr:hypothetical protein HanIR_Chr07g0305621 [Helianthus annuus]
MQDDKAIIVSDAIGLDWIGLGKWYRRRDDEVDKERWSCTVIFYSKTCITR